MSDELMTGSPTASDIRWIEVTVRCEPCQAHVATRVTDAEADYEQDDHVLAEVAWHTADGAAHAIRYTVETFEDALARRAAEMAAASAADALAHQLLLERLQSTRTVDLTHGLAWPF